MSPGPIPCTPTEGFRTAGFRARGAGATLAFTRAGGATGKARLRIYKHSKGRRISRGDVVADFRNRAKSVDWNGRANRPGRRVTNGYYVARFSVPTAAGADVRRFALRRKAGRFTVRGQFHRRTSCNLLNRFRLSQPVFGGKQGVVLRINYRLLRDADVTVVVRRGSKVVKRFGTRRVTAGASQLLKLKPKGLRRGTYKVELTADAGGGSTITTALQSQRL